MILFSKQTHTENAESTEKTYFKKLCDLRVLCVNFCLLFFAFGAVAQTTNALSDAEIEGRALAQKILAQQPTDNFTNTGVLKIKDAKGIRSEMVVVCKTLVTATNWQTIYQASDTNRYETLLVIHTGDQPNTYFYSTNFPAPILGDIPVLGNLFRSRQPLTLGEISAPFAGSDFSFADLGLEFFHWSQQKILPKTTNLKRGRDYTLLESINPNPTMNGYSRVLTWIDNETGGLLEAEAYDANGKKSKDFYPKDFKKVDGQWQVQTLVMENVQTGSRSRLEFDLNR